MTNLNFIREKKIKFVRKPFLSNLNFSILFDVINFCIRKLYLCAETWLKGTFVLAVKKKKKLGLI